MRPRGQLKLTLKQPRKSRSNFTTTTLVTGGSFVTDIDFGGNVGVLEATEATDAFLVRLAP